MGWTTNTKHVPTTLRNACLTRDGNQCTATMTNGRRCPETTNLEADHIHGWQAGEKLTTDMLQTLCKWHHNKKTQRQAAAARKAKQPPTRRRTQKHPGLL
jgi:hypothetical protein